MPRDFKDPVALKLFKKPGVAKDGSPEILLDYVSAAPSRTFSRAYLRVTTHDVGVIAFHRSTR